MTIPTDNLSRAFVQNQWSSICRSTESHATAMAQMSLPEAAAMMLSATKKLTEQTPPITQDELGERMMQSTALSGIITAVGSASDMARMCPNAAAEILAAAKEFSERVPLDNKTVNEESIVLSSKVSALCNRT